MTHRFVTYRSSSGSFGEISTESLSSVSKRHSIELPPFHAHKKLPDNSDSKDFDGLIVYSDLDILPMATLRQIRTWRHEYQVVFIYFVHEQVITLVTIRVWSQQFFLRLATYVYERVLGHYRKSLSATELESAKAHVLDASPESFRRALNGLAINTSKLKISITREGDELRFQGLGIYLRTDYWTNLDGGGSYAHTCYFAKELASKTDDLICLMGSRFYSLDDWGLNQYVLSPELNTGNEMNLLRASRYYEKELQTLVDFLKPSFIYERSVVGNFAGAALSQKLRIPLILEYNGSETSLARASGRAFKDEQLFAAVEDATFAQASVISVVSETLRTSLVARHVDPRKILVNPNGVDTADYKPLSNGAMLQEARAQYGFSSNDVVVAYLGSFAPWHGIEVITNALPKICATDKRVKFLMVGNGPQLKPFRDSVQSQGLQNRVHITGHLTQKDARLPMQIADILVFPCTKPDDDTEFFFSPIKIYEYMAIGKAIVSSAIGQVESTLNPYIRPTHIQEQRPGDASALAVLCTPGSAEEFAEAILSLASNPQRRKLLGNNAHRKAASKHSWDQHVQRLAAFCSSLYHTAPQAPN